MTSSHSDPNLARLVAIESDIRARKLDTAECALENAKHQAPGDPRIDYLEAMLASALGDVPRELACLQRAAQSAPESIMAQRQLVRGLYLHDRVEDAAKAADRAVTRHPQDLTLLEAAFRCNNDLGEFAQAERHLRAALALMPDNLQMQRDLANCLQAQGKHDDAIAVLRGLLTVLPDDAGAMLGIGDVFIRQGRMDEAITHLERAHALAPDSASIQFHLAIARGETPPTQPPDSIATLFDEYAQRFDKHLVGGLKYRVPRRIAETIKARAPALDIDILDLGCGTGLVGAYLRERPRQLIGIDLSQKMLAQAARHGLYTQLRAGELLAELRAAPEQAFDYVVAADVFIYVGELREVIPAIFRVLRRAGTLLFSCEATHDGEGDLALRASRRYAHSREAMRSLCAVAGFARCHVEDIDLRFERGSVLPGFIVSAEKD